MATDGNGRAPTSAVGSPDRDEAVSQTDVILWVSHGTGDDVIVDRLRHASNAVHLTADDEQKLRDAGATDGVIRAIRATAWN